MYEKKYISLLLSIYSNRYLCIDSRNPKLLGVELSRKEELLGMFSKSSLDADNRQQYLPDRAIDMLPHYGRRVWWEVGVGSAP